jgi:hypothetical protein
MVAVVVGGLLPGPEVMLGTEVEPAGGFGAPDGVGEADVDGDADGVEDGGDVESLVLVGVGSITLGGVGFTPGAFVPPLTEGVGELPGAAVTLTVMGAGVAFTSLRTI